MKKVYTGPTKQYYSMHGFAIDENKKIVGHHNFIPHPC